MGILHRVEMDLESKTPTPWLEMPQGDVNTRKIRFLLLANQLPWKVPENATVLIRFRKPNGTVVEYDTLPDGTKAWEVADNTLTVSLAPQVLRYPGIVMLFATIQVADRVLNTFGVEIRVRASNNAVKHRIDHSEEYFNITSVLPSPAVAQAEQYLCVAAVNAQGKVTRVKAVDAGPGNNAVGIVAITIEEEA